MMLKKLKPEKLDVLSTFLERNTPLPGYSKLENAITGTIYKSKNTISNQNSNIYAIYDFPDYLKGHIEDASWTSKAINTYKGSFILLKNYKNIEDYLTQKFSKDRRSKFKTYQKRLETCFNIEYKTYFGHIDRASYEVIFEAFYKMTEKRFIEKNLQNYDLLRWQVYCDIAYPLINSKDAVLFVIYRDEKPISICLNLLKDKTMYGYLRAYDIDYSKFYLGFIDYIKQLYWCFENHIEIFDLLKGSYPYKMRLIDTQYNFQIHIVYNNQLFLNKVVANLLVAKTRMFYVVVKILKNLHVNVIYYKYINYKFRNKEALNQKEISNNIKISYLNKIEVNDQLQEVDINDEAFAFLRRSVFNFLYGQQESINTVKIYRYKNENKAFLIKGNKTAQKITVQPV